MPSGGHGGSGGTPDWTGGPQGRPAPDIAQALAGLGEFGLISRLVARLPGGPDSGSTPGGPDPDAPAGGAPAGGVEVGIGDDAAVLRPTPGRRLVVTTDVLVDGRHFDAALSGPFDWGWKAVVVNVSDVAAMGAVPRWLVLALTIPPSTPVHVLDALYDGIGAACQDAGVVVVGGDVSSGPALSLAVTALGEAERVVTRSGARPGDLLAVTGPVGGAAAGLGLLLRAGPERGHQENGRESPGPADIRERDAARGLLTRFPALEAAHARPRAALDAGPRLARLGATAMLDVSDGLSADVLHLAESSGLGLELDETAVPLVPGVPETAAFLGVDSLDLALGGGDDYVLAVALPPEVARAAAGDPALAALTVCGTFTDDPGHRVSRGPVGERPLAGRGHDHFRV